MQDDDDDITLISDEEFTDAINYLNLKKEVAEVTVTAQIIKDL